MTNIKQTSLLERCVDFAQRLIRTPSMPGKEGEIGKLIMDEMERLDFADVWQDEIGNVYGRINGRDRNLPALALNTHLDHVDPGDPALWPSPPFAAEIHDDRIVGRGAADIKGPLAVQIYSMAGLVHVGKQPRRDVVFTGVVQEETGGAGALHWVENLDYEVGLVVLGEPSSNELALGHRGILQMWVTFPGRSVHASVPESGQNPNYALARFLQRLQGSQGELSSHQLLGATTVAPTIVEVDTSSMNVTPAWTRVLLDFRTASESVDSLRAFVDRLAGGAEYTLSDAWSGQPLHRSAETVFGFYTPPESDVVGRVRAALAEGMGREPRLTSYQFATDGRHFVPHGIPIVGYSPADEDQAHTAGESIAIGMMEEALRGTMQLLLDF